MIGTGAAARIRSVADAEDLARRRLPRFLWEEYEGGAGAGVTLRANVRAFEEMAFRPRVAVFTPERDLRTRVLGHELAMPLMIAPTGLLRFGHSDGERGVARAAGAAGTIQIVSAASATPIEEVVAAASGPIFYQLYMFGGRASAEFQIERARRAGCEALVLTVDQAGALPRERPHRHRARRPASASVRQLLRVAPDLARHPRWLADFLRGGGSLEMPMAALPDGTRRTVFDLFGAVLRPPQWQDVSWIRERWARPLVIKGVLGTDDARRAVDAGADGIVVSNHGGNTLDGAPATLRVLAEIVAVAGDRVEVLLDGGVRRGSDVVKAVALGARAVLIGRACVYPMLAAGEAGVRRILEILRTEIDQTLALLGAPSVNALDPSYLLMPDRPTGAPMAALSAAERGP